MTDTGRTVWADGFWADDFWASGLWSAEEPVTVPDVVGQSQASATAEIEGVGLVVAVVTAHSSTVPAGDVISQSPIAGSEVSAGATVTITVSLGEAPASTGAGRKRRRRKERLLVEIDGQDFEVESEAQAVALLERAKELAVKQIAAARAAPVRVEPGVARPVIKPPSIRTDSDELRPLVRQKRAEIIALYDALLRDLEIQYLIAKAQEADDEEALLRLLM
jgi:hypothetical protein